jgi:hypothetical protein
VAFQFDFDLLSIGHLHILLWRNVYSSHLSIFDLDYLRSSYVLGVNLIINKIFRVCGLTFH